MELLILFYAFVALGFIFLSIIILIKPNMGAYGDDNRKPDFDNETEVPCPGCNGENDACENCGGTGTVTLHGADAVQYEREQRESFREDFREKFNDY